MNFIKQIFSELRKILSSKFILAVALAFILLVCAAFPIFNHVTAVPDYSGGQDITIDGVTFVSGGEFGWGTINLSESKEGISDLAENDNQEKLATELVDTTLDYRLQYAPHINGYDDYRDSLSSFLDSTLEEKFILEKLSSDDVSTEDLMFVMESIVYSEHAANIESFKELSDDKRKARIDELDDILKSFDEVFKNNSLKEYINIIKISNIDKIEYNSEQIKQLEASLKELDDEDEDDKKSINEQIALLNSELESIRAEYETLEYRLENNIVPGDGSWQDNAISFSEYKQDQLGFATSNKYTEEDFNNDIYSVRTFGTYEKYLEDKEAEIAGLEREIEIAHMSLDAGKPDMQFVEGGARSSVYNVFSSTILVSIFAVLIGAFAIATEFQTGTVRLLMIRPRTRGKVMFSRFTAGLLLVYLLYFSLFAISIISNGFISGFGDYMFPNYTAGGEVNFFVALLSDFLISSVGLVFIYTLAFALSVFTRNVAASMIISTICVLGSYVLLNLLAGLPLMQFLSFTPIPYFSMQDYVLGSYLLDSLVGKGMLINAGTGIVTLLVSSLVLIIPTYIVFKKRDITN